MPRRPSVSLGDPAPLGVTVHFDGINVAVFSANAERVEVCLFDESGEREVARLPLGRTGDVHCAFIAGVGPGARYGLRADGPYDLSNGHRFDPQKLLVDPYATALDRPFTLRPELSAPRAAAVDTAPFVPRAVVRPAAVDPARARPATRPSPGFVYEVAVHAFTAGHPALPRALRGTVAGLARPEVIEHLVGLAVDTVELMPVAAWIDERHLVSLGLRNVWGYNPVVFMAPEPRLAPGGLDEIRDAVAALNAAGMRVILDAVYNHTGEGDAEGPTVSLRGLDNAVYYRHADHDPGGLVNDTGTGNTLATDRAPVVRLVVDAMRHWVEATGVDGFRLDLAAVLGRTAHGFHPDAPLLAAIEADPVLSRAIMIAEPWDVGHGGYQLGSFPPGWSEWNDRFRDDVRRFWRGDHGMLGALATRLGGSADIFDRPGRKPSASVNFVAAHDGFTLNDLVTYTRKRNEANGEHNRDGAAENHAWNAGVEGPSDDREVEARRARDIRALLATLFVARGTPMLAAGDEMRRTQDGNNNAYALDFPVVWPAEPHPDARLVGRLARLRAAHPSLAADSFLTGAPVDDTGIPDVEWLHPDRRVPTVDDWHNAVVLGMALYRTGDRTVTWINGGHDAVSAWLPPPQPGRAWIAVLDSVVPTLEPSRPLAHDTIALPARSVLVFAETGCARPP